MPLSFSKLEMSFFSFGFSLSKSFQFTVDYNFSFGKDAILGN